MCAVYSSVPVHMHVYLHIYEACVCFFQFSSNVLVNVYQKVFDFVSFFKIVLCFESCLSSCIDFWSNSSISAKVLFVTKTNL